MLRLPHSFAAGSIAIADLLHSSIIILTTRLSLSLTSCCSHNSVADADAATFNWLNLVEEAGDVIHPLDAFCILAISGVGFVVARSAVSKSSRHVSAGAEGGGYRKGYEPSAPPLAHGTPTYPRSSPYNDPEFAPYAPAPGTRPRHGDEKNETLGDRTMDIVGAVFRGAWKHSRTFLRIDLRRAIRYDGPKIRKRTRGPPITRGGYGQPAGTSVSPGGPLYGGEPTYYGEEEEYDAVGASKSWFGGIQGGGARLKIMQVWDISHGETGETRLPWNINFGFGANVVMDQGRVEPKFRLRANHVALHLLPEPALELRGKWPLGETNLAVYARYRVPISGMGRFWESTNARLMINLYHPFGTGVHLTPGGVQFDEHVIRLGEFTTMRVAAAVDFPKQFPLEEGEQPLRLRVTRLGVKSRIF